MYFWVTWKMKSGIFIFMLIETQIFKKYKFHKKWTCLIKWVIEWKTCFNLEGIYENIFIDVKPKYLHQIAHFVLTIRCSFYVLCLQHVLKTHNFWPPMVLPLAQLTSTQFCIHTVCLNRTNKTNVCDIFSI